MEERRPESGGGRARNWRNKEAQEIHIFQLDVENEDADAVCLAEKRSSCAALCISVLHLTGCWSRSQSAHSYLLQENW